MTLSKRIVCTACSQQCGMIAQVEDNRIVKLAGDPEHPFSQGFSCKKGRAATTLLYDETRVLTPRRRIGRRGEGRWEEIGWDQALDEIAESIEKIAAAHGPEALAYGFGTLHAADWGIGERFMNLFDSPNSVGQDKICGGPHAIAEALTYGWGPTMLSPPTPGVTGCEVLWGCRPAASMPLLWGAIAKARKAGTKLIVIDPQRTHEARLADQFLQVRPGSDGALALGLIDVIVSEGLYDREFVAAETVGFDDLAGRAAEFPPGRVQELTSVPAEQVVTAARMLAGNTPAIVHGGNGLCQSGSGAVQTSRGLTALIALTGSLGVKGGHLLAGPPRDIVANGDAVASDELSPGQRAKRLGADRFPISGAGYAELGAAVATAWPAGRNALNWCATAHEPSLWEAISSGRPYPVKALILQCHNALGSAADAGAVSAALMSEELELLVVHDLFLNKTSALADYLLPAAHWLEKPYYSTGYGYVGWSGDYVAANSAPVDSEIPSDYDLWRDLGRRLGQAEQWPDTAEEFWDSMLRPVGLSFQAVSEHSAPLIGAQARTDAPDTTPEHKYGTPSGRIELRSSLLEDWGLDPLPAYVVPALFEDGGDRFPLLLTTGGRDIGGFHQHIQQMPAYREKNPDPLASLHPQTAAAAGIEDGDWIEIATPVGRVTQRARVTDELEPGVIHADRWWYPERREEAEDPFGFWGTNINVCTDGAAASSDPVMGSWLLRGLPCRIEKAPADP